jgi:hypothetical protein
MNPSRQNKLIGGGVRLVEKQKNPEKKGLQLYENEIESAKKLISICLETRIRWCILLAQMQSGKTMTYYFVLAEMIRREKVEKGVIFSGSAETELRDQVIKSKTEFFVKYEKYLRNELRMDEDKARDLCDPSRGDENCIANKIDIVWSARLKHFSKNNCPRNTFFVWDESHYAQNEKMRPGEFLKDMGICPTGDPEHLEEIGSYLLSVSATPFSELSDQVHMEQQKRVIRMIPGQGYYGIKDLLIGNKVNGFSKWRECLKTALEFHKVPGSPSWAILRKIAKVNTEEINGFAEARGWRVLEYDSETKGLNLEQDLARAPEVDTLIILKGMLRMGKRLKKTHISFAMEMSKSSSSDVALQGLLGRFCGYDANHNTVIYIHENILSRGDLERYVQRMDYDEDILPSKARNLLCTAASRSDLHEIIPLKITNFRVDGSDDLDPCSASREHLITSIKAAIADRRIQNYNDEDQLMDIISQVETYGEEQFKIAHVKRSNKTYDEVPLKISISVESQTPMKLGSGCGINAAGTELGIFIFYENYPAYNIRMGDVFLDARTQVGSRDQVLLKNIPKTTGKEIFCRKLESGVQVESNGAYTIDLPAESSEDQEVMLASLTELIQLSLQTDSVIVRPRRITSNQTGDAQFKGIIVTSSMLESLKPGGDIYKNLRDIRVKLAVKKASGPQPAVLVQRGLVRLAEISW